MDKPRDKLTISSESTNLLREPNTQLESPLEDELIADYIARTYPNPHREDPPSYNIISAPNPPPYGHVFDHENQDTNDTIIPSHGRGRSKSWINTMHILSRTSTILLNLTISILILITLYIFNDTRYAVRSGYHIWPRNPKLYPSFLLLFSSAFVLAVAVIHSCCLNFYFDRRCAKGVWASRLISWGHVVHCLGIFVVASLYGWEKGNRDLRGWSCRMGSKRGIGNGGEGVDLGRICGMQTTAWILWVLEVGLRIVFGVAYFLFSRREYQGRGVYHSVGGSFPLLEETRP